MAIATDIRRRGFRAWYQRELLRSHVHLLLLLLCALATMGALEAFSQRGSAKLLMVASVLVAAAIGAWAVRRYLFHLLRAEAIANQASCAACKSYARWQVEQIEPAAGSDAGGPDSGSIRVRCRRCAHAWRIDW